MKLRCSLCSAELEIANADKKKTNQIAKSLGWKKSRETGGAVCPPCVSASTQTLPPHATLEMLQKTCYNCTHYGHEHFCSSIEVCDNYLLKTDIPSHWPTWEDMHRKRYGDFFKP